MRHIKIPRAIEIPMRVVMLIGDAGLGVDDTTASPSEMEVEERLSDAPFCVGGVAAGDSVMAEGMVVGDDNF